MRTRFAIALAAAVLALAAGVIAAPAPQKLEIHQFKFLPPSLSVAPGTTVTWVNQDEETHTVTSATGAFASTALEHDGKFTHTFSAPGTYTYFCALHPLMRAAVVVK